jgi:hypothetical protein
MSAMGGKTERVREDASRLVEEIGNVKQAAGKLVGDVRETVGAFDVTRRVEERPLTSVAVAAGVGFVLGGGLFRPIFSRAIRTGVRLALVPYLKSQLFRYAAEAFTGQGGSPDVDVAGGSAV